jgi:IS5 family transposase
VKSAIKPIRDIGIKKQKDKRETPDGKLDKNGNALKFSRDVESDWVVKNDVPHYRLKEHTSVDVKNGFVMATTLTPASVHDTNYLPYLALASYHSKKPIKKIYADKGYHGEPNGLFLHLNDIEDGLRLVEASAYASKRIMRKDTKTAKITEIEIKRNKQILNKRYIRFQPGGLTSRRVEQYFGLSHPHTGFRFVEIASNSERAQRARFTTIVKNTWDAMCR